MTTFHPIPKVSEAQAEKERPILFSGEMVRAILDGRKTQTRRIVKPNLMVENGWVFKHPNPARLGKYIGGVVRAECPHGQLGERLWVRETFLNNALEGYPPVYFYRADDDDKPEDRKWKPSIFMPRKASRITLEIVSVKVERLQEISEEDAKAEGVEASKSVEMKNGDPCYTTPYQILWNQINGIGEWEKNPWVWAITFKKL